jgi:hypothetical protein
MQAPLDEYNKLYSPLQLNRSDLIRSAIQHHRLRPKRRLELQEERLRV